MIDRRLSVLLLFLFSFALGAEPESAPLGSSWQVTLERTDLSGKVRSQTKVRISASEAGGAVRGQMMINMADDSKRRFWTVNFETAPKEGFMTYGIRDSNLIHESFTNGNLSVTQVYVCDANVPWKGAGRYPILVYGEDRLVLGLKPSGQTEDSLPTHVAPMWIELTQKNASGDAIARSSAPWFAIHGARHELDLALPTKTHADPSPEPIARSFRLWEESLVGLPAALRVRMRDWGPKTGPLLGFVTYDLLIPLNTAEAMPVYEQDDEKLEAAIRPPGETESGSK
jgi:hypothetical protein